MFVIGYYYFDQKINFDGFESLIGVNYLIVCLMRID